MNDFETKKAEETVNILGHVVIDRKPISDAKVVLIPLHRNKTYRTVTNEKGLYSVQIPKGKYTMYVDADDFAGVFYNIDIVKEMQRLAITELEYVYERLICPKGHTFTIELSPGKKRGMKLCPECGIKLDIEETEEKLIKLLGEAEEKVKELGVKEEKRELKLEETEVECPSCGNTFIIKVTERPMKVTCPHCGVSGTIDST